ncbi:hypothetical protein [Streptomyces sp. DSM 40750]|uniref:hypothetical protein n=1 Tax=Streptomyces sp. DSM 40750 TaxID=2801030 RepID=UPI00214AA7F8|nr:hypothetical protein [Streptomyces sp. DSM 40750]UUU19118.1 hypothetical protein JIX55_01545 [Streptomyces sp. DSM 40750]UUU27538.1 hypothetical protein JIX55_49200 [Streptomyces sp. DSM 40750]
MHDGTRLASAVSLRDPLLRAFMSNWLQAGRDALAQHFDPTARALDALVESFALHNHFDPAPTSRADITAIVRTAAGRHKDPGPRQ